MKKYYSYILSMFIISLLTSSCKEEKIMMYQQNAGLQFRGQANTDFSFYASEENSAIVDIPVLVSGMSSEKDRKVNMELVVDDTNYVNTANETQYKILDGIVKAGEFKGTAKIQFTKTPDMKDSTFVIYLKLRPNEDFPLAGYNDAVVQVSVTDRLIRPSNWGNLQFYVGEYSTSWYSFILNVLDLKYIPYNLGPAEEQWSYNMLLSQVGKIKAALLEYNRLHPNDKLTHDDGLLADEEVVMP